MNDEKSPAYILHVDDNLGDYDLLSIALAEFKMEIVLRHVENAMLAFSFLGRQCPFQDAPTIDLILLDVNLPVINGLKALDIIASTVEWAHIPVMMLTSSLCQKEKHLAIALGAKDFLTKPSDWEGYLGLAGHISQWIVDLRNHKIRNEPYGPPSSGIL